MAGAEFSACVNQRGALFDMRQGVGVFLLYLCTENIVSAIIPPQISVLSCSS